MATPDPHIPTGTSVDRRTRISTPEFGGLPWLALGHGPTLRPLEAAGANLERAASGATYIRRLHELRPRLAIVIAPPAGTSEILATISERRQRATLRVVYLNELTEIAARLEAMVLGFDDALPVTIDPVELVGRIRLMLSGATAPLVAPRRSTIAPGIELDVAARRVVRDGSDIHLRPKEFALLAVLATDPGRVFTRDELVDLAWGSRYRGNVRTVDVHVRWLRAKLERDPARPRHVVTVRGTGYRLDATAR